MFSYNYRINISVWIAIWLYAIPISFPTIAQNKIDENIKGFYKENVAKNMDTSYVNYQIETWSLRAFSIFKDHSFQLVNSGKRLTYKPNNRFGVGFGVAYYPLLVDVGFNIKTSDEQSRRFDLQADLILLDNYIGFVVQDYQGFNINGSQFDQSVYRDDIRSSTVQLTYGYAFNSRRLSMGSIFSGFHQQKKSVGTFILGGFLNYYNMEADSSVVPVELDHLFSSLSSLKKINSVGGGIIGGYGHIIVLPHNFFLFANVFAGLGLVSKKIHTESDDFKVSDPMLYRLNLRLTAGYNGSRFYIILTGGDDITYTSLDFGNWGLLNVGKAKLIIGYKFNKY